MRAIRLQAVNWRRHRSIDIEFGSFTVIRGPNGSGKSSIVDAIVFALTGDGDVEDISQDAGGEPAMVRFEFQHKGAVCVVQRRLVRDGKSTATLTVGDESVTGIRNVRDALGLLLGADDSRIRRDIFVQQGEIDAFIDDTDAVRASTFTKLFGTDKAEKIWKALGEVKLPDAAITIDGQAVAEALTALRGMAAAVEAELTSIRATGLRSQAELDAASAVIRDYPSASSKRMQLIEVEKTTFGASTALGDADNDFATLSQQVAALRKTAAEEAEASRVASAELAAWHDYTNWLGYHAEVEKRGAAATARLSGLQASRPVAPANIVAEVDVQARASDLLQARVMVDFLQRFLQTFDPASGVAVCPLCRTPASTLASQLEDSKRILPEWRARVELLEGIIAASNKHYNEMRLWQHSVSVAEASLAEANAALAASGVKTCPARSQAVLSGVLNAAANSSRRLVSVEMQLGKLEADRVKLAAMLAEATARKTSLVAELRGLEHATQEAYSAALAVREEHSKAAAAVAGVEMRKAILLGDIQAKEKMLEAFEAERRRHWAIKNAAMHLEEVRGAFHRENLPARIHAFCLHRIQQRLNRMLERFNKPYRVVGTDGIRFVIKFSDGRTHGESRLSHGEKVIFAIAFRFAVNSTFAQELGILFLDEPTAYLDEDTTGNFEAAFQELRDVSRASGLQLGLITHERGLDAPCDKVIELSAGVYDDHPGTGQKQRQAVV